MQVYKDVLCRRQHAAVFSVAVALRLLGYLACVVLAYIIAHASGDMWRKVKTIPIQPNVSFSSNALAYFAVRACLLAAQYPDLYLSAAHHKLSRPRMQPGQLLGRASALQVSSGCALLHLQSLLSTAPVRYKRSGSSAPHRQRPGAGANLWARLRRTRCLLQAEDPAVSKIWTTSAAANQLLGSQLAVASIQVLPACHVQPSFYLKNP